MSNLGVLLRSQNTRLRMGKIDFGLEKCRIFKILFSKWFVLELASILSDTLYLTRFAIQAKGPDGKWTRKPLAYRVSNNVHLLIARPPEICVNLVFKHIHAASSYTICRQFVPFIYCPL